MGTFYVDFTLWGRDGTLSQTFNGLVDTGSTYSQAPASALEELGVERERFQRFIMADGSRRQLALGWVSMELQGEVANVYVIFGSEGSSILLGALALETFGPAADASTKRLIPGELTL